MVFHRGKQFYPHNTYLLSEVKNVMAEKIMKTGIKREAGFLYFVDKKGDAARAPMARAGMRTRKGPETLAKASIKKEKGYLYFIDKQGDIARAKMARGGHKKVKTKTKAKTMKKKAKGKKRRK